MTVGTLALRSALPPATVPGDLEPVEQVVRVNFPVEAARTFLRRHLGNEIRIRLVEAARGERLGHVREVEILPAAGGEAMVVRARRTLEDGSPATFHSPDDAVRVETEVVTGAGRPPFPLTPRDVLVLHVPVRGYTRYLPALFQGAAPTTRRDLVRADEVSARRWGTRDEARSTEVTAAVADPLRRFLFVFQHLMTTVVDRVDQLPSLTDPIAADPRFLPWIASWVHFELDASLPVHQQRELVRRAIRLYRSRGTTEGVEEMVRVLTSVPVRILEREKPPPAVLGSMPLAGGGNVVDRYHRNEPPAHFLATPDRPATRYFVLLLESRTRFRQRFGERAPEVLRRISRIVSTEKPAHVQFTIRFADTD